MLLGDIIARLDDEAVAAEALLRLGDLGLLADLSALAAAEGLTLGSYAAWAVRAYADAAPADEWLGLLADLVRVDDPGAAYLRRALAFVVASAAPELPS